MLWCYKIEDLTKQAKKHGKSPWSSEDRESSGVTSSITLQRFPAGILSVSHGVAESQWATSDIYRLICLIRTIAAKSLVALQRSRTFSMPRIRIGPPGL